MELARCHDMVQDQERLHIRSSFWSPQCHLVLLVVLFSFDACFQTLSFTSLDAFDVRREMIDPFKEPLNSREARTSASTQLISSSSWDLEASFSFLVALFLPRALRTLAFVGRKTPLGFLFSSAAVKVNLPFGCCEFGTLVLLPADSGPVPVKEEEI